MKFIDINSVRGLEIDQPVFTKDADGNFGYGRLVEEKKTSDGITRTFEILVFTEHECDVITVTNITHVCIPK